MKIKDILIKVERGEKLNILEKVKIIEYYKTFFKKNNI